MDETDKDEKNNILLLLNKENMMIINEKQKLRITIQEFVNQNSSLVQDIKYFFNSLANLFCELNYICSNSPKI